MKLFKPVYSVKLNVEQLEHKRFKRSETNIEPNFNSTMSSTDSGIKQFKPELNLDVVKVINRFQFKY